MLHPHDPFVGDVRHLLAGLDHLEPLGVPLTGQQVASIDRVTLQPLELPAEPLRTAPGVVGLALGIVGAQVDVAHRVMQRPRLALALDQEIDIVLVELLQQLGPQRVQLFRARAPACSRFQPGV